MKFFKTIHITKKMVGCLALGGLLLASAAFALPPAAARVSAMVTANAERKLPIYCVQTEKPQISVSFDAAWGAEDTDELLRILAENDVKATFFLCGYWVEKYPDEVKKIAEAGHDLGNHSATHPHMSQISSEQISQELQKCHQNVKDLTGVEMDLFRPPFGEYDNHVIETAEANGYYTIQWDVDRFEIKICRKKMAANWLPKSLGSGEVEPLAFYPYSCCDLAQPHKRHNPPLILCT